MEENPSKSNFKCTFCKKTFSRIFNLKRHMKNVHNAVLPKGEIFKFSDFNEFLIWKEQLESETSSMYVRQRGNEVKENGDKILRYYCNRSGVYKARGKGLKRLKSQGSVKIGASCPAKMVVKITSENVIVNFFQTHENHTMDVEHLRLPQSEREAIAGNRHRRHFIQNNREYCYGANKYVSDKLALEYPNTVGTNFDPCSVKLERIDDDDDDDDDSSVETVSPSNPQASPFVRNADKSPNRLVTSTDLSSMHQTNLPNCNLTANEGSSSLQSSSKSLDNVRYTHEFDDVSRSDLPEINGSSENNSKLKNSTEELLDIITSPSTDPSPNGRQSVSNDDDNVVSVLPESSQIRTTIEKPSSCPSTPTPSVAVEQALQDVEMTFEIGSSDTSVPSPPTAMEQTHQNAEMVFEIDSNCLTTSSTSTAMKETHQNGEMALEKSSDYPSTSGLCTAIVPLGQNTEFAFEKSCSNSPTPDHFTDPNRQHLPELLDSYSEPCSTERREMMFDEKNLPKRSYLPIRKQPARSCHTSERVHSTIRDKLCLKNEVRSIFERLDEAKRVYENKCRIIMDDYKILLNKLSQESDPTFLPSDILTPEYASSWNSLKLLKILLSEENSSEENKQNTFDGQHDNSSNYNENFSANHTRGFSHGSTSQTRGSSHGRGFSHTRQYRKRGRKRTHEVSRKIFVNETSKCNKY